MSTVVISGGGVDAVVAYAGPRGATGPRGPAGDHDPLRFASYADAAAATVDDRFNVIETEGYYVPGDYGGARWVRRASEPSHPGKLQTADGAWWEIDVRVVTPEMTGAVGAAENAGAPDDQTALEAALAVALATSRKARLSPGRIYGLTRPLRIPAGLPSEFTMEGSGPAEINDGDACPVGALFKLPSFNGAAAVIVGEFSDTTDIVGVANVTRGATTVTGVGTSWSTGGAGEALADGDVVQIVSGEYDGVHYIESVNSDTEFTLYEGFGGRTVTGAVIRRVNPAQNGTIGNIHVRDLMILGGAHDDTGGDIRPGGGIEFRSAGVSACERVTPHYCWAGYGIVDHGGWLTSYKDCAPRKSYGGYDLRYGARKMTNTDVSGKHSNGHEDRLGLGKSRPGRVIVPNRLYSLLIIPGEMKFNNLLCEISEDADTLFELHAGAAARFNGCTFPQRSTVEQSCMRIGRLGGAHKPCNVIFDGVVFQHTSVGGSSVAIELESGPAAVNNAAGEGNLYFAPSCIWNLYNGSHAISARRSDGAFLAGEQRIFLHAPLTRDQLVVDDPNGVIATRTQGVDSPHGYITIGGRTITINTGGTFERIGGTWTERHTSSTFALTGGSRIIAQAENEHRLYHVSGFVTLEPAAGAAGAVEASLALGFRDSSESETSATEITEATSTVTLPAAGDMAELRVEWIGFIDELDFIELLVTTDTGDNLFVSGGSLIVRALPD